MNESKKTFFCKYKSCPSANLLLSYSNRKAAENEAAAVVWHLGECEFCSAELHFLRAHAALEETVKPPEEMPFQLRQLAEVLLGGKQLEFSVLRGLFGAPEPVSRRRASLTI